MTYSKFYLIRIEFLGFRYHGWQKQPGLKTVHLMIDKTIEFVFQHADFKTLGCGRTDAKVSADDYAFELFCKEELGHNFIQKLNTSLPGDIRAKSIEPVAQNFNILQHPKIKEYHYYFSFGEKMHPFSAPLIVNIPKELNLERMQKAARMLTGTHHFKSFTSKPSEESQFEREILLAEIIPTNRFEGDFFPEKVYVFRIKSKGFLRYQVRMLMGTLIALGEGKISGGEFQELITKNGEQVRWIAPGSGLCLHKVIF